MKELTCNDRLNKVRPKASLIQKIGHHSRKCLWFDFAAFSELIEIETEAKSFVNC